MTCYEKKQSKALAAFAYFVTPGLSAEQSILCYKVYLYTNLLIAPLTLDTVDFHFSFLLEGEVVILGRLLKSIVCLTLAKFFYFHCLPEFLIRLTL